MSTSRQELGPEAQRTAITEWATRTGVTIVAWHEDRGVSGSTPLEDRPGLLAALSSLLAHGAGVLAITRRDRIARDVVVAGLIERAVTAAGASVVSADGSGNGNSPSDQLLRTILDAVSAHEKSMIGLRTRQALAEKKAKGQKLGGHVPFGFRSVLSDDGRTRTLVRHDDEHRVIDLVRSLRSDGVSLRSIVARLAESGVRSRSGAPLGLTQVARILASVPASVAA